MYLVRMYFEKKYRYYNKDGPYLKKKNKKNL